VKRRTFITLLGGALAFAVVARRRERCCTPAWVAVLLLIATTFSLGAIASKYCQTIHPFDYRPERHYQSRFHDREPQPVDNAHWRRILRCPAHGPHHCRFNRYGV